MSLIFSLITVAATLAAPTVAPAGWYEVRGGQVQLHLYVFTSQGCPHCAAAERFLDGLQQRSPWLTIHRHDITASAEGRELYRRMAEELGQPGGQTPAFVFCKRLQIGFVGDDTSGRRLEQELTRYRDGLQRQLDQRIRSDAGRAVILATLVVLTADAENVDALPFDDLDLDALQSAEEETVAVPGWGNVAVADVSLPAMTVVMAGLDAFNPCAFFVLMILLGLMLRGGSRWRMLVVGGVFVFFSGFMYFLFMAAWLNLFFVAGNLRPITLVAGGLAITAATINVKDFFWFKKGVSLSIPESARAGLIRRMNGLVRTAGVVPLILGTAALAAVANLYELLCTAGFPLVFTRVLTLRELSPAGYYGYLLLYNVVYVTPLALIVTGFALTLGRHTLSEYEGRVLKLLSGMMMLALGGMLVVRPELLNHLGGAAATLAAAIGGTALIVAFDLMRNRHRSGRSLPMTRTLR